MKKETDGCGINHDQLTLTYRMKCAMTRPIWMESQLKKQNC